MARGCSSASQTAPAIRRGLTVLSRGGEARRQAGSQGTTRRWYFTALARDAADTPYSVFFTLFSSGGAIVPVAQVRNLETGALVGHSEQLAFARVSPSTLDVRLSHARLRYEPATNAWVFSASGSGFAVSIRQRPDKAYALHGEGTGLIQQSLAGIAHYYSATRMRAAGTLHDGGTKITLTGES
jgi:CrtC N-terminal lipocalin domain